MESSFTINVSLVLNEAFIRPQIAYPLLHRRNKFGSCYCTIAIQFDTLNFCF